MNTTPKTDFVVDKGSRTNEDMATVRDRTAWVLDGHSGFTDRSLTDHPDSDGVWYVETVDGYLRDHVSDDESLETIVAGAISHAAEELIDQIDANSNIDAGTVDGAVEIAEIPGATIALVRWSDTILEYYVLADSTVLVDTDGVDRYTVSGPERFDERIRELVGDYTSANPDATDEQLYQHLLPHIRENRKHRDVPGGFWTVGVNPFAATRGVSGDYPLEEVDNVYLFSDGFEQIVSLFDLFEDWESAAAFVDDQGVDAALDRLRTAQRADERAAAFPRIKPMDDVSLVHLDFTE